MRHRSLFLVFVLLAGMGLFSGRGAAGAGRVALLDGQVRGPAAEPCAPTAGNWTVERPDAPKDFGAQGSRTMALDAAGQAHVVYGGDHLYYAWYDGVLWHRETVDPAMGVGVYASLALDASGHPHISYYDDTNDDVKYAHFDGLAWQIQVIDPSVGAS